MTDPAAPGCMTYRHDLGAYVLGGLAPEEARALEDHLSACAVCREEHRQLADLPELLDLVRSPGPQVPSLLRDRVVADAARRQGRRRRLATTAAAALVAGLVGLGVGWQLDGAPEPTVLIALQAEEPFADAEGWATVSPAADGEGLIVSLEVAGLPALDDPQVYEAWLYRQDQRIVSIGQLEVADGEAAVELAASGDLGDYRGFWITAEPDGRDPAHDGPTVLRAPLPDPAGSP